MPPNQQPSGSVPFWDFIHSLDPSYAAGGGVDHNNNNNNNHNNWSPDFFAGFPFGPQGHPPHPPHRGPWGADFDWEQGWGPWAGRGRRGRHHGPRGRHAHRHHGGSSDDEAPEQANAAEANAERSGDNDNEKADSPDTMRVDVPDPDEVAPEESDRPEPGHGHGFGCRGGPGRGGCGGRGGFRRGGRGGPHHGPRHFHGPPPPPYPGAQPPFDFAGVLRGLGGHPFFQNLREQAENFRAAAQNNSQTGDPDAFVPPVDIFNTDVSFVLHVALPGAKKDDVGVNWDPDSGVLNVAGVVHRPGDEAFLQTLSAAERKVGVFERNVTLPPAGAEKDEIDGDAITAKMEDGVLIITVPKVEKEWTEIRKVDIE